MFINIHTELASLMGQLFHFCIELSGDLLSLHRDETDKVSRYQQCVTWLCISAKKTCERGHWKRRGAACSSHFRRVSGP